MSTMDKSYQHNGEKYMDIVYSKCDECGKDWMLRPKTQWANGHTLLAFVDDLYGNSWVLCNRCFKQCGRHEKLWVTAYIKPKEEEDE